MITNQTKSDYQKYRQKRWECNAWSIAFTIMSVATILLSHEIKNERILATQTIEEYKDSLNIIKASQIEGKGTKQREWNALIQALIIIETEGQVNPEKAVGDNGKAVGVLQIHPIVIDDIRIAGYNYSLIDRYDREKSIEIWNIWQSIYNPEKDIWKAIKRHNPKWSWNTCQRIIRIKDIIIERNDKRDI